MLNAQCENLITYIKDETFDVFWVDGTIKGDIYHRFSGEVKEDNEMKAFFDGNLGKYVDLYNVDFNDIRVFKKVDWMI